MVSQYTINRKFADWRGLLSESRSLLAFETRVLQIVDFHSIPRDSNDKGRSGHVGVPECPTSGLPALKLKACSPPPGKILEPGGPENALYLSVILIII